MLFCPDLCVYCKMYSTLQFIKETFRTCSRSCSDFHNCCHYKATLPSQHGWLWDSTYAIIFFVSTPESVTDAPTEGWKAAAWWSAICLSTAINSTCQGNLANRAGSNIKVEMKLFSLYLKIDGGIETNCRNILLRNNQTQLRKCNFKTGVVQEHLLYFGSLQSCVWWGGKVLWIYQVFPLLPCSHRILHLSTRLQLC